MLGLERVLRPWQIRSVQCTEHEGPAKMGIGLQWLLNKMTPAPPAVQVIPPAPKKKGR